MKCYTTITKNEENLDALIENDKELSLKKAVGSMVYTDCSQFANVIHDFMSFEMVIGSGERGLKEPLV